ncbi:MAG: hypothetical protein HKN43_01825 [Rhodothermales bacterium]|nr:hypothetical protein [Rhodothermales bacterium]
MEDNLGALDISLSDGQRDRLGEVSQVDLGFTHDFLYSDRIQEIVYGGT